MKNLTRALACIVLLLSGCAVRYETCSPSAEVKKKDNCPFVQHPTDCIGSVWFNLECQTENL